MAMDDWEAIGERKRERTRRTIHLHMKVGELNLIKLFVVVVVVVVVVVGSGDDVLVVALFSLLLVFFHYDRAFCLSLSCFSFLDNFG